MKRPTRAELAVFGVRLHEMLEREPEPEPGELRPDLVILDEVSTMPLRPVQRRVLEEMRDMKAATVSVPFRHGMSFMHWLAVLNEGRPRGWVACKVEPE